MPSSSCSPPSSWTLPCLPESSFATPAAARSSVNTFAGQFGYAVVQTGRMYDKKTPPQLRRIVLSCDRHGVKRQHISTCNDPSKRRKGKSRRCGCPMQVHLVRMLETQTWQVQHRGTASKHNHPPSSGPSEHPILRRESRTKADFEEGLPVTVEAPAAILTEGDVRTVRQRRNNGSGTAMVAAAPLSNEVNVQLASSAPSGEAVTIADQVAAGQPTTAGAERRRIATQSRPNVDVPRTWTLLCLPESSYDSPEAARAAVNTFAGRYGYAVVNQGTIYDKKTPPRPRRVILKCDRHGTKRQHTTTSSGPRLRKSSSRRCGCPMEVNLVRILPSAGEAERWEVQHRGKATIHNHPPSSGPSEHPVLRRMSLTDAARRIIAADMQAKVPIPKTLARLAARSPGMPLTASDLYNERHMMATNPLEGDLPPPTEIPQASEASIWPQARIPLDLSGSARGAPPPHPRPEAQISTMTLPSSNAVNLASAPHDKSPRQPDGNDDQPRQAWIFPCLPESLFDSPEAARAAANTFAARHGYALVHKATVRDKKKPPRPRRIILACDRHGSKRVFTSTCDPSKQRKKRSRRCGCPMEVNLIRVRSNEGVAEQWQVQHRGTAREHNHPPSEGPSAHPVLRRDSRTDVVQQVIVADAEAGHSASQTVAHLAVKAPGVVVTLADINNEKQKIATSSTNQRQ